MSERLSAPSESACLASIFGIRRRRGTNYVAIYRWMEGSRRLAQGLWRSTVNPDSLPTRPVGYRNTLHCSTARNATDATILHWQLNQQIGNCSNKLSSSIYIIIKIITKLGINHYQICYSKISYCILFWGSLSLKI